MSDYTDALRGLADDVATLKATLLPVATGPDIAALVASIEQRVANLPQAEPEKPKAKASPDRPAAEDQRPAKEQPSHGSSVAAQDRRPAEDQVPRGPVKSTKSTTKSTKP